MACCYIAASMIGFLVHTCEALDLKIGVEYNDASRIAYEEEELFTGENDCSFEDGITVVSIAGMTCAACTGAVEQALKRVKGVRESLVSLPLQEARIFHDVAVERELLKSAIEGVGYDAKIGQRDPSTKANALAHSQELDTLRQSIKSLAVLSTCIFGLGTGADMLGLRRFLSTTWLPNLLEIGRKWMLFLLAVAAAGHYGQWIFRSALSTVVKGQFQMDTLVSLSVGLSLTLALGQNLQGRRLAGTPDSMYYDSVVGVLLIVAMGRYIELLSRRRATETFAGLYTLLHKTGSARLAAVAEGHRVPTSLIRTGDDIAISPFSIVPCDSYVVTGRSHVNEALITGEALPKVKGPGDVLLAGCRNGPDELRARVTQRDNKTSFLAQLVRSVEDSLGAKASVQQRIDTVTQHFVSAIIAIALVVGTYTFFATPSSQSPIHAASRKIITILAAACPCALGLATPCAIMAGVDVAWRCGILLLQGGETMESIVRATHVVMDKTGTLTQGSFAVRDMALSPNWSSIHRKIELAVLCCAAEERAMTAHPLALAVFRYLLPVAGEQWGQYKALGGAVQSLVETPGRGIQCLVSWEGHGLREITVGSREFMHEAHIKHPDALPHIVPSTRGTLVFVAVDGEVAASISLKDSAKRDAKSTIQALKERSLNVSMLTGDNATEANRISRELSIPILDAHATPSTKLDHIKTLQDSKAKVLMVGDGMNDSPALAASEVGVMMAHGNKCFSSGGTVLLLRPELRGLVSLLDIASSTVSQINANIAWALGYNILAVGLAIGFGEPFGLTISPTVAAMMMSASSLFVSVQGLLLRKRLASKHCSDGTGLIWDF